MSKWPVEFYRDRNGAEPVKSWLDSLPEEVRARMLARIGMLRDHGPMLDFPYTSQVEGRMREIRWRFGKTRYRTLYFFDENRMAVLLHGITKDTDKLEEFDKKIARERMVDHSRRVEEARAKSATSIRKKK